MRNERYIEKKKKKNNLCHQVKCSESRTHTSISNGLFLNKHAQTLMLPKDANFASVKSIILSLRTSQQH